jgi:hypothetical protein
MSNRVGERWFRFAEVCGAVGNNPKYFDERSIDFCRETEERLDQYAEATFLSVAQINWLNRLEDQCVTHGLLQRR